ncbi:NUDIX domain-containing protein [Streptomyces sp. NPDC047525]|uniref:NUDIX hydrolase n=1 Tax=Streptomyces sp. NPDC047525 TaxID=3155264 RepID=UPI0034029B04
MPLSHTKIRKTVETYLARHPDERESLAPLLEGLGRAESTFGRSTLPGHVTCSAVVISRGRRVLHIAHRASGGLLLAPGGHIEPQDRTPLATALRELSEEAGIAPAALCLTPQLLGSPIDIDASPSKGEPRPQHYDLRYAFYVVDEEPPTVALQEEKVSGAQWLAFEDVTSPTLRAKLLTSGLDGQPEPVNASALIHNGQGSYLLQLRSANRPIWEPWVMSLPGGGRAPGDEDLEHTVRRELAEEIPELHLDDVQPYAVEAATSVDGLQVPLTVFTGEWRGDPRGLRTHEGVLLHWAGPDELDELRLSPGLADLIHRHATEHPAQMAPADPVPPTWDGGSKTVLNGVGVHLYLQDTEGRVLLGLRDPNNRYAASTWHFLAGRLERESASSCLVREAFDEAGLIIDPASLELVHLAHVVDAPGGLPLMQLVFRAHRWQGVPQLREPDKCQAWQWWDPKALPERLVPYARTAINGVAAGLLYSEMGW